MGANTNQLNVAGPSKIEHNKRIKKKEAPVIENRPHLNKPTRTRYNGVAANMKELPPLTKPVYFCFLNKTASYFRDILTDRSR